MARQRTGITSEGTNGGGRGSKEAIAKRRAARQLNTILLAGVPSDKLDGRTEKRRKRLIKELKEGRRGRPLKPIDFLSHAQELFDLGETLQSLKKAGVKPRSAEESPALASAAQFVQEAYKFKPEVWLLLGITPDESNRGGKPAKTAKASKGPRPAKTRPAPRKRAKKD